MIKHAIPKIIVVIEHTINVGTIVKIPPPTVKITFIIQPKHGITENNPPIEAGINHSIITAAIPTIHTKKPNIRTSKSKNIYGNENGNSGIADNEIITNINSPIVMLISIRQTIIQLQQYDPINQITVPKQGMTDIIIGIIRHTITPKATRIATIA